MPMSESTVVADHPDTSGVCVACPHPSSEHDPISARFCTATVAGALPRGCICPRYRPESNQATSRTSACRQPLGRARRATG